MLARLFGAKTSDPEPPAPAAEIKPPAAEIVPQPPPPAPMEPPEPEADGKATAPAVPAIPDEGNKGWFARLKSGLSRSSTALSTGVSAVFTKRKLDAQTLEDLEDLLIQADLGVEVAAKITARLGDGRFDKGLEPEAVRRFLAAEIEAVLAPVARPLDVGGATPHVVLVVGVNGTGKTTTIGKLAAQLVGEGRSVMLAAGDTFRAAAIEQLVIWGTRVGVPVVAGKQGADAAGLAFDAFARAKAEGVDVLLVDTAGRLHNKADLMAELEKVIRVLKKQNLEAPHTVLLVLDATTGQNAIAQTQVFRDIAGVTGIVMTKLDGTARGGILVGIAAKFGLPVHAIGVGEGIDDMAPFDAGDFARAIVGVDVGVSDGPEVPEAERQL
ncbi:MAG: signal recognition particle-docking protein FtsY [Alphaproteobacteria bacterium]